LVEFGRHCNRADYERGLHHLAAFASPTMQLFDELRTDGVQFEMKANGLLFAFLGLEAAEKELASLLPMRKYGYDIDGEPLMSDALHELAPVLSDAVRFGVFVAGERHIAPGGLLAALSKRLQADGVEIQEGCDVSGFIRNGNRVSGLTMGSDAFDVDGVLIAAGAWSKSLAGRLGVHLPIEAGKGYSFSLDLDQATPTLPIYLGEAMIGCTPIGGHVRLAGTLDLSLVDGAGVGFAVRIDLAGGELVIALALALLLALEGLLDARIDGGAGFAVCLLQQILLRQCAHLYLHVDAVQQRAGNLVLITRHRIRRAAAFSVAVAQVAARAWFHCLFADHLKVPSKRSTGADSRGL
jgi:glycine/D-amino acid oxidase-like deaminating enzyme